MLIAGGFFLVKICLGQAALPESGFEKPFVYGESVKYKILYNWGLIWVEAGEVTFSVDKQKHLGKDVYHFVGDGKTYPKYDWFYKVRDRYESYSDFVNLRPYRFIRDVEEGKVYYHNQYLFKHKEDKAYSFFKRPGKEMKRDTIDFPSQVYDVLSMIYYARCIPWEEYESGDEIPIKLILDGEVYDTYIRYLGKENKKIDGMGLQACIKFQPRLIEGTIFPGGEDMSVWVSDDKNRVPLYIKTPILVGNIRAVVQEMNGLKH